MTFIEPHIRTSLNIQLDNGRSYLIMIWVYTKFSELPNYLTSDARSYFWSHFDVAKTLFIGRRDENKQIENVHMYPNADDLPTLIDGLVIGKVINVVLVLKRIENG